MDNGKWIMENWGRDTRTRII